MIQLLAARYFSETATVLKTDEPIPLFIYCAIAFISCYALGYVLGAIMARY